MIEDSERQRIFCVTIYVINRHRQFVMLHHRKLDKWLPPGGKIDPHETPDESAVRECWEETGLRIELIGSKAPVEGGLYTPYGIQLNPIVPQKKDHVDLIYFGKPTLGEQLQLSEREAIDIGWFSLEKIRTLSTFPSVIQWCTFFEKQIV